MAVVAPGGLTPAPFALSPRHQYLAVGMGTSAAARGSDSGAARVEVLRLLRGEENQTPGLHVDCVLEAPGLRSLAWSTTYRIVGDAAFILEDMYPGGVLAGGFDDGTLRIWSPSSTLLYNLQEFKVPAKAEAIWILNKDPEIAKSEESEISSGIKRMYTEIDEISWTEWEDVHIWELIENDSESLGWELLEKPGVEYQKTTPMNLLMEMQMSEPVLGLSFSHLIPNWLATAAFSDSICVHDLIYSQLSKRKLKISEPATGHKFHTTSLKWSRECPTMLASSGDLAAKVWDIRSPLAQRGCFTSFKDKVPSSDVEFSWNNPMLIAVSSQASATVKIWDLRNKFYPLHTYDSGGAAGVLSLSWNSLGQLLASHTNGRTSCYDVFEEKMLKGMDLPHCDRGLTWTHSEDVAVTLSSQIGVKICKI